jgi:hypothetical protein
MYRRGTPTEKPRPMETLMLMTMLVILMNQNVLENAVGVMKPIGKTRGAVEVVLTTAEMVGVVESAKRN